MAGGDVQAETVQNAELRYSIRLECLSTQIEVPELEYAHTLRKLDDPLL